MKQTYSGQTGEGKESEDNSNWGLDEGCKAGNGGGWVGGVVELWLSSNPCLQFAGVAGHSILDFLGAAVVEESSEFVFAIVNNGRITLDNGGVILSHGSKSQKSEQSQCNCGFHIEGLNLKLY